MLMQCPRCKLVVEAPAPQRCRNCGGELVELKREEAAPADVLDHAPTTKKRPGEPIRHD